MTEEDKINRDNAIFKLLFELVSIKEPTSHHIDEVIKNIDEAYLFFGKKEGGRLHFTKLAERVERNTDNKQ